MKLSLIAAVGKNGELGKDGNLIWRFREDMKYFAKITKGHKIVMGRKTFESLPGLLPDREHIVLTRNPANIPQGVAVFNNVEDFLKFYQNTDEEIFNIGGSSIYEQMLDYADNIYLTEINAEAEADVFFPDFDKTKYDLISKGLDVEDKTLFKYMLYKRRK